MNSQLLLKVGITIAYIVALLPILPMFVFTITVGWVFFFDAPYKGPLDLLQKIGGLMLFIIPPVMVIVSIVLVWLRSPWWALLAIPAVMYLLVTNRTEFTHVYPNVYEAVTAHDIVGIQKLIDKKANLNEPLDEFGRPPVVVAVSIYDYVAAETLIKAGADTSHCSSGDSLLDKAVEHIQFKLTPENSPQGQALQRIHGLLKDTVKPCPPL